MSAALPSLGQPRMQGGREPLMRPPQHKGRKNRHRASIMVSKDGFNRGQNSKAIEEKLGEQFRYFRKEFLDAALSIGVPVPLDMVEDKAGRVYTFVQQKGPRYLFQIMHGNPDSAHLLRCSLSLLIVTISILRGKLPSNNSLGQDGGSHMWLNVLSENISSWALDSLTSIADGSAVAICTNLLRHSHSQTIQELILNLLAQLVNITEEAANQMLLYPTITSTDTPQKPQDIKDNDDNRAESPVPRTPKSISGGLNDSSTVSSASIRKMGNHDTEENYTCLSYMFTVVAHHRNRYTVMTACAEVVLALVANKSPLICEEIARTRVSTVIIEDDDTRQRVHSNTHFGKYIPCPPIYINAHIDHDVRSFCVRFIECNSWFIGQRKKKLKPATHSSDWAALKLMLKFLQRFMRYAVAAIQANDGSKSLVSGSEHEPCVASQQSSQSAPPPQKHVCADIAVVPQKHKNSLATAHARVLLAVCELINYSPAVGSYVLTMPGARAIMKASCMLHKDSPDIKSSIIQCMHVLQRESERVYKEVSSHRHSVSYELTHGRASKLFNPAAVLARAPTPKLQERPTTGSRVTSPQRMNSPSPTLQMNPFTSEFLIPGDDPNKVDIMVLRYDEEGEGVHEEQRSDWGGVSQQQVSRVETLTQASTGTIFEEGSADREEDDDDDDTDWLKPNATYKPAVKPLLQAEPAPPRKERSFTMSDVATRKSTSELKVGTDFKNSDPPRHTTSAPGPAANPRCQTLSHHSPSKVESYKPPESPPRRGIRSPGEQACLHRDLFSYLPETPSMPHRLEAMDIINGTAQPQPGISTMEYMDSSMKHSLSLSTTIVNQAYQTGSYDFSKELLVLNVLIGFYVNGKSSVPISERARRAYGSGKKRPKTANDLIQSTILSLSTKRCDSKADPANGNKFPPPRSRPQTSAGDPRDLNGSEYKSGGLLLDGLGGVEEGVSDFQMFLENKKYHLEERARSTHKEGNGRSLSPGKKHHQVLQSLDVLFP